MVILLQQQWNTVVLLGYSKEKAQLVLINKILQSILNCPGSQWSETKMEY